MRAREGGGYMHSSLYFFRPVASIVYGGSQFFFGGGGAVWTVFGVVGIGFTVDCGTALGGGFVVTTGALDVAFGSTVLGSVLSGGGGSGMARSEVGSGVAVADAVAVEVAVAVAVGETVAL